MRRASILDRLSVSRWLTWLPAPSLDANPVLWCEWHRNRPSRMVRAIWLLYVIGSVAGAGVGVHEAMVYGPSTPSGVITPSIVLVVQFIFGLMIVSSLAPASLVEERVRGSLDVLLTTPLSTPSILWGKWLGTYRVVVWLSVLPALTMAILAGITPAVTNRFGTVDTVSLADRIAAPSLIVLQMLCYGAIITSIGLALATWVRQPALAITINIVILVLVAIGWPLFFEAAIWYPLQEWLASAGSADARWVVSATMAISPFAAPIVTLQGLLEFDSSSRWKVWVASTVWCVIASASAEAVFWAAAGTFDRCLGRMPDVDLWD